MTRLLHLALGLFGLGLAASETVCPQNVLDNLDIEYLWMFGDDCFYFNLRSRMEYLDAANFCINYGGTLAMPKTKTRNKSIIDTMQIDYNSDQALWIGLNDITEEGKYEWLDGTPVEWNAFAKDTGGFGGDDEDCIALQPANGKWHDYECIDGLVFWAFGDAKKSFVCEFTGVPMEGLNATTTEAPEVGSTTLVLQPESTTEAAPADSTTEAPPADSTTEAPPMENVPEAQEEEPASE